MKFGYTDLNILSERQFFYSTSKETKKDYPTNEINIYPINYTKHFEGDEATKEEMLEAARKGFFDALELLLESEQSEPKAGIYVLKSLRVYITLAFKSDTPFYMATCESEGVLYGLY